MASAFTVFRRGIATSSACHGKKNFRHILLYNKRGSRAFRKQQMENPDPDLPIDKRGTRDTGLKVNGKFVTIPEMIPELIVPSLEGFTLKPYVTYKSDIKQDAFTPRHLFTAVYAPKIKKDYEENKLTPDGQPLHPSEYESLTPEEAKLRAERTGADMFCYEPPREPK